MAYIKVFPIRASVKKFVRYVTNPDKTNEQILVSSFGCSPETVEATFEITRQRGIGNMRDTNGNRAWHIIQSFKPGEVSAEKAHEIGEQLAEKFLKGLSYTLRLYKNRSFLFYFPLASYLAPTPLS